ncbi:hypothetical protein [Sphingopyxis sp.]|uniref:hypothetical protein n=1 Tax=Sphingopyxis sp. TaxID=1908224 RepID=UPI0025CCF184|nr:hypothetical protein [Sphingopyxis sp.]MBK6414139.1 hypothetical protein [Sphingopyxis sp.]
MTHTYEQIAADFYPGTKTIPATVRVYQIDNGQRRTLYEGDVAGKRDARMIAKQFNATPWNF